MIYHLLCLGVDQLLYWNAHKNANDDILLSKLMQQFDQMSTLNISETNFKSKETFKCDWNAEYLMTSMAKNPNLFRFTPSLDENKFVESY